MRPSLLLIALLLTGCLHSGIPSDATEGEISMAKMMGITVKELRNQTPQEHMQMMMNMMNESEEVEGFLPGQGLDISMLPAVVPTETITVEDGDSIAFTATIVRKEINGKEFAMYGYNAQIPGPIINAPQGSTITVDVTNNIDMETTIHWHGLRLDNANDGVPKLTQDPILIGETYRYTITFPDEGIYWYHPHVREDIQQDMGLYGNLLIMPEDDDAYSPVNEIEILVLDDITLDQYGNLIPYGIDDATFPLMGRFGNVMIINGDTSYAKTYKKNAVVRYYITNVANTRTFRLIFGDAQMKLVGSDVGRYEHEEFIEALIIAPAERYIVDVYFPAEGAYTLTHESPLTTIALGSIYVDEESATPDLSQTYKTLRENADVIADIDDFRDYFNAPIDKTLRLSIETSMEHVMEHTDDGIEWEDTMPEMNAMMTADDVEWQLIDEDTGEANMDFMWEFTVGDIAKIKIINDEDSAHPMQHPIHFHGQRFLVLSMNGVKNENLVWKDTVLIPIGSEAELLFDMTNPGDWMFHCHIAEHLTNGMMGMFRVSPTE